LFCGAVGQPCRHRGPPRHVTEAFVRRIDSGRDVLNLVHLDARPLTRAEQRHPQQVVKPDVRQRTRVPD
jgi:hypothetical protein